MTSATRVKPRRRNRNRTITILGLCLIVIGLGFMGYVGWQYYGTNVVSKRHHGQIKEDLQSNWDEGIDGDAIGLVRIKRFGEDYEIPLVEGFDDEALANGIGWNPDGAKAGEVGNFAISGHRVTHGEPFRDFLDLRAGDTVEIETRTHIYTYKLTNSGDSLTLPFTSSWPLQDVPKKGHAGETPQDPKLTMVTCSELFHTDNRNVVFGDLVSKEAKDHAKGTSD